MLVKQLHRLVLKRINFKYRNRRFIYNNPQILEAKCTVKKTLKTSTACVSVYSIVKLEWH